MSQSTLSTPATARVPAAPGAVTRLEAVVIGAGVAGLYQLYKLREMGMKVRAYDTASGVGGTWYWNRYPGAQCDTASMVYMPLLEETGHRPTEKYAHAPEILAQCQRIAQQYGLREHAMFHTQVTALQWDEAASVWRIRTDRGDDFSADVARETR